MCDMEPLLCVTSIENQLAMNIIKFIQESKHTFLLTRKQEMMARLTLYNVYNIHCTY